MDKTILCKEGYLIPKKNKYNDIIKKAKKNVRLLLFAIILPSFKKVNRDGVKYVF